MSLTSVGERICAEYCLLDTCELMGIVGTGLSLNPVEYTTRFSHPLTVPYLPCYFVPLPMSKRQVKIPEC